MTPPDDVSDALKKARRVARQVEANATRVEMADELHDALDTLREWMDKLSALHRSAKVDVSRLVAQVEELEEVRVTCHNGHTSTLAYLRENADCSAPCCPECGECSYTFEPSEAFDD